jgi:hypothetical protein
MVEDILKYRMKDKIVPVNHEFVIQTDYMTIVQSLEDIMKFIGLQYKVEENLHLYNRCIEDDYENEVKSRD